MRNTEAQSVFAAVTVAFIVLIMGMYFMAMAIVMEGLGIALLMTFAVGTGYVFAPGWIKRVSMWGPIAYIIDIALSFGLTYALGMTLRGFVAGIIFGILVSLIIKFEQLRLYGPQRGGTHHDGSGSPTGYGRHCSGHLHHTSVLEEEGSRTE